MIEIFVTSYSPNNLTIQCINSILDTAVQPFSLTVISTKGSAAQNKNLAIRMTKSDKLILLDDDLSFQTKGWNKLFIDDLNSFPWCSVVGGKVIEKNGYKTMSYQAHQNAIVDNVRVTGCALAIRKAGIIYDERYMRSQCDDIDFLLENMKQGHKVLCDTRILITHLNPQPPKKDEVVQANINLAFTKWTKDYYMKWGRDPKKFKVIKSF